VLRELLDCITKYVVVLDQNGINLWSNIRADGPADRRLGWWGLGAGVGECYLNPYCSPIMPGMRRVSIGPRIRRCIGSNGPDVNPSVEAHDDISEHFIDE
jgi:hypothetical protein